MEYAKKFLCFNEFIAPKVITFIYWFSLLGAIGASVAMMFTQGGGLIKGILSLIFLPILVRVYFEIIMVIFNINKNLQSLADAKAAEKK